MKLIKTKTYEKSVSGLPMGHAVEEAEEEICLFPLRFPIIPGTGGIRKARFSIANRGKSGGGRICYLYLPVDEEIFLLKAYAKNQQTNLTKADSQHLKSAVEHIKKGDTSWIKIS